ncbi:MAG: hypothetical protein VX777_08850 [Chlamydiota bacterium]|nr:hypothetical protein [Chlamydiota bacterium]
MSRQVFITAKSTEQDCSWKGQVDRWGHRPLITANKELASMGSFTGRGYCALEFCHTIVREPYRGFKNVLLVWEKIYQFVRNFFETLFSEDGTSWKALSADGKELAGRVLAIFARVLTYMLDLVKLATGILVPAAAIRKLELLAPIPVANPV